MDRDWGDPAQAPPNALAWDAYHIENYLLDPAAVLAVMAELSESDHAIDTPDKLLDAFIESARATLPRLLRQRLLTRANALLRRAVEVGASPDDELEVSMRLSVDGAIARTVNLGETELSRDAIDAFVAGSRTELEHALQSDAWMANFRGRDVLAEFVQRHVRGVTYEAFRDLIVARMRTRGHRPAGMEVVLKEIVPL